jgi:hypothetical protein
MGRYARSSSFRTLLAANIKPFPIGLVPLSDSSLKIQDETERELVFQEKFVSIFTIIPHLPNLIPSLLSIQRPDPTRSAAQLPSTFSAIYGPNSHPNIYICSLIAFSTFRHHLPGWQMERTIILSKIYITPR